MDLKINTQDVPGNVIILTPIGEVDIYTSPVLKEKINSLIEHNSRRILIDLSHLEYIDSTGIGVIRSSLNQIHSCNGDIRLLSPTVLVKRMLELTNVDRIARVYDKQSDALRDWANNNETAKTVIPPVSEDGPRQSSNGSEYTERRDNAP